MKRYDLLTWGSYSRGNLRRTSEGEQTHVPALGTWPATPWGRRRRRAERTQCTRRPTSPLVSSFHHKGARGMRQSQDEYIIITVIMDERQKLYNKWRKQRQYKSVTDYQNDSSTWISRETERGRVYTCFVVVVVVAVVLSSCSSSFSTILVAFLHPLCNKSQMIKEVDCLLIYCNSWKNVDYVFLSDIFTSFGVSAVDYLQLIF